MIRSLFIFGTRPEAIKLAPIIHEFSRRLEAFEVVTCVTGQHREMLDQVLNFFQIKPEIDLNVMNRNQSLFDITATCIQRLQKALEDVKPDIIFVQGDTTTTFISALAGYYKKIKAAHIEAGLRSGNKFSPYPEEANRILTSHLVDYHFAPTITAKNNLLKENITSPIHIVGNSVIDALMLGLEMIDTSQEKTMYTMYKFVDFSKKVILVTGHRRESFGLPFHNICTALQRIAEQNTDVEIVYPVHLNPNVRKHVYSLLSDIKNIHLIEPLDYPGFIWMMKQAYVVLTDSGGVQEEAPSLGKPVLVMRNVTERIEGIEAGTAHLVGTDSDTIITKTQELLENTEVYTTMATAKNPYGDGTTSRQIADIITRIYTA